MESGPATPRRLIEPGQITSYLLIAGAGLLMVTELFMSLRVGLPGKVGTATWVVFEAPGLALMAAFTGAATAAGGSWWARRREHASGTTIRSIGYGIGAAAIAGSVVAVLAWASINQEVSGKVALASFFAALGGGLLGSVRIGGAVLGGLVGALVAMVISSAGGLVMSWTLTDASAEPQAFAAYMESVLLVVTLVRVLGVAVGTGVGCWWLTRRRRETGLPYFLLVGGFSALLQLVSAPIAWLAALPVADDLPDGVFVGDVAGQQLVSLLVVLATGLVTALTGFAVHKATTARRATGASAPRPAAAM